VSTESPALVRCPTAATAVDGTPHTVIGCGASIPDIRDDEGLVDCLACGIWFDPDEEGQHGS
jgi:hypothetical protein